MWYALLGIACIAVGIAAGYLWAKRPVREVGMAHKIYATLRDAITGVEFETVGRIDELPTGGLVLVHAEADPESRIQIPIVGLEDQQPDPVLDARFVNPPTSIEVNVPTAFIPELFTQFGTAEEYEGNETRWTFSTSNGSFTGNELTASAAGSITVTAEHTGGFVAAHTLTAFVDDTVPPETSVFEVDFSGEVNDTTLDEITTASGHTFVVKDNPGATASVQGGRFITTSPSTLTTLARMVGDAPPAEYDHLFTIQVISHESLHIQAGVAARVSVDFSAGYNFYYTTRNTSGETGPGFHIVAGGGPFAIAPMSLAPGTYQCRARIRNAFKAIDLMVGGEWQQVASLNDNSFVGGMPGVYVRGAGNGTVGVGLISAEGLAPSADPQVDTEVTIGGVPANAVENTDYQIHAELRQLGGGVVSDSLDSPGDWTHVVEAGGGQATIGGPNDDILQVGPLV